MKDQRSQPPAQDTIEKHSVTQQRNTTEQTQSENKLSSGKRFNGTHIRRENQSAYKTGCYKPSERGEIQDFQSGKARKT